MAWLGAQPFAPSRRTASIMPRWLMKGIMAARRSQAGVEQSKPFADAQAIVTDGHGGEWTSPHLRSLGRAARQATTSRRSGHAARRR